MAEPIEPTDPIGRAFMQPEFRGQPYERPLPADYVAVTRVDPRAAPPDPPPENPPPDDPLAGLLNGGAGDGGDGD